MHWITENLGTIIVSGVLLLVVGLILWKMHRDRKSGKGGCGCGCSTCSMRDGCGKTSKRNNK